MIKNLISHVMNWYKNKTSKNEKKLFVNNKVYTYQNRENNDM